MKQYLLGIDIGTSSMKVALVDDRMRIVASAARCHRVEHPTPDRSELDLHRLWSHLIDCLGEIYEGGHDLHAVAGIGLSCLSPGFIPIGKDGELLSRAILYTDRRSIAEEQWIKKQIGIKRIFDITANNLMAGAISVTSMLWIKNHRPDLYRQTAYFGHINSAFSSLLTGCVAIDPSNASYTGLFSTVEGDWSKELCDAIGIAADKLPPILPSQEICGYLSAREIIDLGISAGTPVIIGGADTPCGAMASGAIHDGDICESVGTSNVLTICVKDPIFRSEYLNRCHVVDPYWVYQGAMSNVGASVDWCLHTLCKDLLQHAQKNGIRAHALLDEEAALSPPGANGVVFLPYLSGERSPIWDPKATGAFFGITGNAQRHDLVRAVLESSCYGIRQLLEIAEQSTGRSFSEINLFGGAAKSLIWGQMKADIVGKPINILEKNNASVLGAAILAGVGVGLFHDIGQAVSLLDQKIFKRLTPTEDGHIKAILDARYRTYTALYPSIKDLFDWDQEAIPR